MIDNRNIVERTSDLFDLLTSLSTVDRDDELALQSLPRAIAVAAKEAEEMLEIIRDIQDKRLLEIQEKYHSPKPVSTGHRVKLTSNE